MILRPLHWVVAGIAAAVGIFYAGCRVQATHDTRLEDRAQQHADSILNAVAQAHQHVVDSLTAEDAKAHATAVLAQAETARLRLAAAGHAIGDRRRDVALSSARNAADSLPIVVGQRDDARLSYATLVVADSIARAADSTELARRLDLAEKRRLSDSTSAKVRDDARVEDLKGLTLQLDRAQHAWKLFGLIPVACTVGYGVVAAPSTPIKVNHGVGAMCGIKIGIHL